MKKRQMGWLGRRLWLATLPALRCAMLPCAVPALCYCRVVPERLADWLIGWLPHPPALRCTLLHTTALQGLEWVVVVKYTLVATVKVTVEVLVKAEIAIYLFFRVQAPTIPWWTGERGGEGGRRWVVIDGRNGWVGGRSGVCGWAGRTVGSRRNMRQGSPSAATQLQRLISASSLLPCQRCPRMVLPPLPPSPAHPRRPLRLRVHQQPGGRLQAQHPARDAPRHRPGLLRQHLLPPRWLK